MSLSELYEGCRTYRRFSQDPVPENVIGEILSNLRARSSARNGQILKFYVIQSPEKVGKMQPLVKWAGALPPEIGTPKQGEQPTAFVVITKPENAGGFSDVDVGIAADTIALTAWNHGFGSCMMGAINTKEIGKLLELPEGESVRLAIALGRPAHKSTIVDVPEDGSLNYYVDGERDYYVPKKTVAEISKIV